MNNKTIKNDEDKSHAHIDLTTTACQQVIIACRHGKLNYRYDNNSCITAATMLAES